MNITQALVDGLYNPNHTQAYRCLQQLEDESCRSAAVYPFFDTFAAMLDSPNSYIRTRGLVLIAQNSRWDREHKIDKIMTRYLTHVTDDKPITARQCIKMLPVIAEYHPALKPAIENVLCHADLSRYPETMRSLVQKDIRLCLRQINHL